MSAAGYRCATCGRWHDEIPMSYVFRAPEPWHALSWREGRHSLAVEQREGITMARVHELAEAIAHRG